MAITDQLSFFLECGEASGPREDSTANNLDFTDVNTVTSNTGKVGDAAQFVAVNAERLSRGSETLLQPGPDFTIQFWHYADSLTGMIICKDNVGSNRTLSVDWSSNTIRFIVFDSSSGLSVASSAGLSTVTWYHVICTYTSADKKPRIIINNGTPVAGGALTNGILTTGTAPFEIGGRVASAFPLNGRLDQFGFWKRVLTADEITWLYNTGNGRSYAEMVATNAAFKPAWARGSNILIQAA